MSKGKAADFFQCGGKIEVCDVGLTLEAVVGDALELCIMQVNGMQTTQIAGCREAGDEAHVGLVHRSFYL